MYRHHVSDVCRFYECVALRDKCKTTRFTSFYPGVTCARPNEPLFLLAYPMDCIMGGVSCDLGSALHPGWSMCSFLLLKKASPLWLL